jgi:hypothetical protein
MRQRLEAPIVPVGCIGLWGKPLQSAKYYFNPDAFTVNGIDTRAQSWIFAGGSKPSAAGEFLPRR